MYKFLKVFIMRKAQKRAFLIIKQNTYSKPIIQKLVLLGLIA